MSDTRYGVDDVFIDAAGARWHVTRVYGLLDRETLYTIGSISVFGSHSMVVSESELERFFNQA